MTKKVLFVASGHEFVKWSSPESSYYDYEVLCPYSRSKLIALPGRGEIFKCGCGSMFDIDAYIALDKVTG